ncbi:MAG: hypothetical protein HFH35_01595 [Eubacterium sp.]|nr:hypothetical protein [Eubacterium sp.]
MLEQILEQILAQVIPNLQLITAALIFVVAALELIHIGQTSRINRKLSRAGRWLQRYLNTVLSESTQEPEQEEEEIPLSARIREEDAQLEVAEVPRSTQEEQMRVSLERKKLRKDEELLDSVLQEIFD